MVYADSIDEKYVAKVNPLNLVWNPEKGELKKSPLVGVKGGGPYPGKKGGCDFP